MAEEGPSHLIRLNPEQYRAVTTLEGPLLILAGAGSGKTRVLTRRIAHLLHEGVDPENILAVTFTNKAAAEMKERVHELVGERAEKLWISTFHSTCVRILRMDIEKLEYTGKFAIYDDDDQLRLVKDILEELGYARDPSDESEPDPSTDPRYLLSQIDDFKNRMLSPEDLVRQRRARSDEAKIRVYRSYQERMKTADAVDFNDLIALTVTLLRQYPEVRNKYQERFVYLMVDEYQDTNPAQYELLRQMTGPRRNLAVVGDDDQSIYAFRGADISNILGFERDFPGATVIRLEQNYRSTGHILEISNQLVRHNNHTGRKQKTLRTEAEQGERVMLVERDNPDDEANWVAAAIRKLVRMSYGYSDIAIIYRTNRTSRLFESALRRMAIPLTIIGGKKLYERREVRDIIAYLRLLVNPADDTSFLRIVNVPRRGVGPKTLQKLREDAANRGEPLLTVSRSHALGKSPGAKGLATFIKLMERLADASRELSVAGLVHTTLHESGYWEMLDSDRDDEAKRRMENLQELVADARAFEAPPEAVTPIEQLLSWMDRAKLTGASDEEAEDGQVTLMTVHASKGLEFPIVFVVQMVEGQFPHRRSAERDADVAEERRLTYVAFTRAQKRLYLTRSLHQSSPDGKKTELATPSRFLFEVPRTSCRGDFPVHPEDRPIAGETPDEVHVEYEPEERAAPRAPKRRRAVTPEPAAPAGTYVTMDLESPDQLKPGVRVLHANYGLCTVLQNNGATVRLERERGGRFPSPIRGDLLQLVADDSC